MQNQIYTLILGVIVAFAAIASAFFAYQSYQLELIKTISESNVQTVSTDSKPRD